MQVGRRVAHLGVARVEILDLIHEMHACLEEGVAQMAQRTHHAELPRHLPLHLRLIGRVVVATDATAQRAATVAPRARIPSTRRRHPLLRAGVRAGRLLLLLLLLLLERRA